MKFLYLPVLLFFITTTAQVSHTIGEFTKNSDHYTAFNYGTGSTSTVIDSTDYTSGITSLKITYSFDAGAGFFFSSFKGYGTAQQDYSYLTTGFSISHKGGNADDKISVRLWEDINGNGLYDGTDEVYQSTDANLGTGNWTKSTFPIGSFTKVVGTGNDQIDLNRIRGWDVKISNPTGTVHGGVVNVDLFQLESSYTPPTTGTAQLKGSFTQLWNSVGCQCGQWTQTQWNDELAEMKANQLDAFIVQYGVYDNISWYSPSTSPVLNVTTQESTINKIVTAAELNNMEVHFGLYFDENWNSSDKALPATYTDILNKHKAVIDELWGLFGTSTAFGGWYIPQEINDLEWQETAKKNLLFTFLKDVTDYAKTKSATKPTMIAPFFNLWQPADIVGDWYDELLGVATNLDRVYPQDGVGITLKNPEYHIPLYFSEIKSACDNNSRDFGAIIESFIQTSGWPIDNGTFAAVSTNINQLKKQLWAAGEHMPYELIQFEWAYMQKDLNPEATLLYNDYYDYVNVTLSKDEYVIQPKLRLYPNPAKNNINITNLDNQEYQIINSIGMVVSEGNVSLNQKINIQNLISGVYFIKFKNNNTIKFVKK